MKSDLAKKFIGVGLIILLTGCFSVSAKDESYKFNKDDFKNSPEYMNYKNSDNFFPQVLVTIRINKTDEKIISSNPGEAAAIRGYLLRKYEPDSTRVLETFKSLDNSKDSLTIN